MTDRSETLLPSQTRGNRVNRRQCVILSGGLGTRLGDLGRSRPKHLVDVLGRPFAHRQLEWLRTQGVTDVVECVGHLGDEIRAELGDGSRFGLSITYSDDGVQGATSPRPGTGGALVLAHRRGLLQERFCVLYGDSWLRLDLGSLWDEAARNGAPATMAIIENSNGREASNVSLDEHRLRYAKGQGVAQNQPERTHLDYGISVISRHLIAGLDDGTATPHLDLADAVAAWSARGLVAPFEVSRPYDEVGTPEGIDRLEAALLAGDR